MKLLHPSVEVSGSDPNCQVYTIREVIFEVITSLCGGQWFRS